MASERRSTLTLAQLDTLLDQLTTLSPFSQLSQIPSNPPSPAKILTTPYLDTLLISYTLALLTQIILRDLRPLLNPLPGLIVRNPTTMLRMKTRTAPAHLEIITAMRCRDRRMAEMYLDGKGDIEWCADVLESINTEHPGQSSTGGIPKGPVVSVNVQVGTALDLAEYC